MKKNEHPAWILNRLPRFFEDQNQGQVKPNPVQSGPLMGQVGSSQVLPPNRSDVVIACGPGPKAVAPSLELRSTRGQDKPGGYSPIFIPGRAGRADSALQSHNEGCGTGLARPRRQPPIALRPSNFVCACCPKIYRYTKKSRKDGRRVFFCGPISHFKKKARVDDFCLSTSARFDNEHRKCCLASRRPVSGRGPMAQGNSPHNPMAFASA